MRTEVWAEDGGGRVEGEVGGHAGKPKGGSQGAALVACLSMKHITTG